MKTPFLITFVVLTFLAASVSPAYGVEDQVQITQGVSEEEEEEEEEAPAPAPRPGDFIRDIFPPRITDIQVAAGYNSAVIFWKTSEPARSQLFWGETTEYEKEAMVGTEFTEEHSAALSGLSQLTQYHFTIEAEDESGNTGHIEDRVFETTAAPDVIAPANVRNFRAESGDGKIQLTWQNPPEADFQAVKILRSPFFYPQDPFDGLPIYNSDGEFFVDTDVENGKKYYYTAFAYDKSGNFSSGAVAFAVPGEIVPPPELFPPTVPMPPELEELTLEDFDFWQEGEKLPLIDGRLVRVKIGPPLTVSIDYEKVPEVLKTIMITLEKPAQALTEDRPPYVFLEAQASVEEELANRRFFSFILRINPEKTRYEAVLMPPEDELFYPMFVNVMDFKHQALKRLEGEIQTTAPPSLPRVPWYKDTRNWRYLIYILLLALLVYALRRKRKKEIKKPLGKRPFDTEAGGVEPHTR